MTKTFCQCMYFMLLFLQNVKVMNSVRLPFTSAKFDTPSLCQCWLCCCVPNHLDFKWKSFSLCSSSSKLHGGSSSSFPVKNF